MCRPGEKASKSRGYCASLNLATEKATVGAIQLRSPLAAAIGKAGYSATPVAAQQLNPAPSLIPSGGRCRKRIIDAHWWHQCCSNSLASLDAQWLGAIGVGDTGSILAGLALSARLEGQGTLAIWICWFPWAPARHISLSVYLLIQSGGGMLTTFTLKPRQPSSRLSCVSG
jgi:hypothetical protein